jgi:hypothetical protein
MNTSKMLLTILFSLAIGSCAANQSRAQASIASVTDIKVETRAPSYCDRFPAMCRPCDVQPCGEPIGLVCCEEPLGCFGVFAYSDCEGDIYSCEWGYQGRNADGTAYVECFDE